MGLKGRVAVVTGASSGIGRAVAIGFAREGADVILFARDPKRLGQVSREVRSEGAKALVVRGDVGVEEDVRRIGEAVRDLGRVDVLVNNAGIVHVHKPVHELPVEVWDRVIQTNLRGAFLASRQVIPFMLERGYGRIINVTSGVKHSALRAAYGVSKSALDALTFTLAAEYGDSGILVNALDPGVVRSGLLPDYPVPAESVVPTAIEMATLAAGGTNGEIFYV